jgi:hypothetical protein
MINRAEMLDRIRTTEERRIPITNYGVAISYVHGCWDEPCLHFRMRRLFWIKKPIPKNTNKPIKSISYQQFSASVVIRREVRFPWIFLPQDDNVFCNIFKL